MLRIKILHHIRDFATIYAFSIKYVLASESGRSIVINLSFCVYATCRKLLTAKKRLNRRMSKRIFRVL